MSPAELEHSFSCHQRLRWIVVDSVGDRFEVDFRIERVVSQKFLESCRATAVEISVSRIY